MQLAYEEHDNTGSSNGANPRARTVNCTKRWSCQQLQPCAVVCMACQRGHAVLCISPQGYWILCKVCHQVWTDSEESEGWQHLPEGCTEAPDKQRRRKRLLSPRNLPPASPATNVQSIPGLHCAELGWIACRRRAIGWRPACNCFVHTGPLHCPPCYPTVPTYEASSLCSAIHHSWGVGFRPILQEKRRCGHSASLLVSWTKRPKLWAVLSSEIDAVQTFPTRWGTARGSRFLCSCICHLPPIWQCSTFPGRRHSQAWVAEPTPFRRWQCWGMLLGCHVPNLITCSKNMSILLVR